MGPSGIDAYTFLGVGAAGRTPDAVDTRLWSTASGSPPRRVPSPVTPTVNGQAVRDLMVKAQQPGRPAYHRTRAAPTRPIRDETPVPAAVPVLARCGWWLGPRLGWYELPVPSIPVKADCPDVGGPSALQQVADAFGLGAVTRVEVVTEGLMNRNWRVTTVTGVWAVKQVLDVDAAAARRQHRATAALAGVGLPVPAPVTAGDDTVVVVDGAVYTMLPWADGIHRRGPTLTVAEASALGELLARLHAALAEMMPPAPDRLVVPATDLPTAHAKIDRYLGLITQRPGRDGFDRFAETQLHQRRRLLDQVAHLRPTEGVPVEPCGYTHGDFQYLNLLWNQGRVSAVLDWDRLDVRPVGLEVARSATLLFGYGDERGLDLARPPPSAAATANADPSPTPTWPMRSIGCGGSASATTCGSYGCTTTTPTHPATTCSPRRRPCWPGGPPTATRSPPRSPQADRGDGARPCGTHGRAGQAARPAGPRWRVPAEARHVSRQTGPATAGGRPAGHRETGPPGCPRAPPVAQPVATTADATNQRRERPRPG